MVVQHVPSPVDGAASKVQTSYTGPLDSPVAQGMLSCDPNGPLMVHIVKLHSTPDGNTFTAFGRVMSGTVRGGQAVAVLGEAYSVEDEEDMSLQTVESVSISGGRYRIDVSRAPAGNWIMMEGIFG